MTTHPTLLTLLPAQNGLVTSAQAEEHRLPARTLRNRARDDGWNRVAPRVYLAGGHPYDDRARIRAAGLWAGDAGAVSGPAAAWWHGMLDDAPAEVGGHRAAPPRPPGLPRRPRPPTRPRSGRPHAGRPHPRHHPRAHGARDGDLPAGRFGVPGPLPAQARLLPRRLPGLLPQHGARGFARVAALLEAAADRADSAAERILVKLLRGAGITGWEPGLPFGQWKIDIAFPDVRVAVEIDSWAWHTDVQRFRSDRHKGNALVQAGWTLLRFTWHDLTGRPDYVIAQIGAALLASAATA